MNTPNNLGTVEDLIRRFSKAQSNWELWRSLHQEAFDYAAPNRETFTYHSEGQKKNRQIFDSTAILGLQQFANRVKAALVPSWQQWGDFVAGDNVPEEERERVNELLEETTKTVFSHLNYSNFSTEIDAALVDLGIGTGAILIEEGDFAKGETVRFVNIPLAELCPETPPSGAVESCWRKQSLAVSHIKRVWSQAELPSKLEAQAKKEPFSQVEILNGMLFDPVDGMYHQVVIHEPSKALLFTQAFKEKRLIVFRWSVTPAETFGRGVVIQMLPDIRTVNVVKKFTLENAAIQMAGMYTAVDDGVFNPHTFRVAPAVVNTVSSNMTNNPSIAALPRAGDIGLGSFVLQDLQDGIRKAFFADPMGDIQDPVRSATEQVLRQQEMLRQSGAALGRLKSEMVEPIIKAIVGILADLGKIPPIRVDGKEAVLKLSSPLAKQEGMENFQNDQVWLSTLAQYLPPEVIAGSVKVEDIPRNWQEKLGVDASLVRSDEEREQLANAAQQAQAEQGQPMPQGGEGGI